MASANDDILVLRGHTKAVSCCAFSLASKVVTGSCDGSIKLWDPLTGTCIRTITHTTAVCGCAVTRDDPRYIIAATVYAVHIYDSRTGNLTGISHRPPRPADGLILAAGLPWDDTTTRDILCFMQTRPNGLVTWGYSFTYSSNGLLLAGVSDRFDVKLWDPHSGACVRSLRGHTDMIIGCAFSPDDTLLATASIDSTARVWEVCTGACVHTLVGHIGMVRRCVFSSDGLLLATASGDQTAKLWDARTGSCVHTFLGHSQDVMCCDFSPDGSLLVTASLDKTARIWHVPRRLRTRGKVLLMVVIGNRATNRLRLPAELWQWMDEQGFL